MNTPTPEALSDLADAFARRSRQRFDAAKDAFTNGSVAGSRAGRSAATSYANAAFELRALLGLNPDGTDPDHT